MARLEAVFHSPFSGASTRQAFASRSGARACGRSSSWPSIVDATCHHRPSSYCFFAFSFCGHRGLPELSRLDSESAGHDEDGSHSFKLFWTSHSTQQLQSPSPLRVEHRKHLPEPFLVSLAPRFDAISAESVPNLIFTNEPVIN